MSVRTPPRFAPRLAMRAAAWLHHLSRGTVWSLVLSVMVCVAAQAHGQGSSARAGTRSPLPGAPPEVLAIVNVTVVPMDRERLVPNQTVLVHHGWITAMGPASHLSVPAGAIRIDGRGKFLIPGLADMHAHIMYSSPFLYSGVAVDSVEAARRLFLWLANGVTTIRNMDHDLIPVGGLTWKRRAATGTIVSPQIYTAGPVKLRDTTPPGEIAARIAAYKAEGYDFIKMHPPTPGQYLDSISAAAHRLNVPLAGHMLEGVRVDQAIRAGYASIEHLEGYLEYLRKPPNPADPAPPRDSIPALVAWQNRQLDLSKLPGIVALTKAKGVWNCPTEEVEERSTIDVSVKTLRQQPESAYYSPSEAKFWTFVNNPKTFREGIHGLDMIRAGGALAVRDKIIKALQDAGAGLLLGVDAPVEFLVQGFSVHRELQALVHAGLTPYQALVTGTRNPAQYFGTLQESGTVAVGKRADLVLLDGNPLADIRQTSHIAGVMYWGKWLSRADIDQRLPAYVGKR